MNNQAVVITDDLLPADPIGVAVALHRQGLEAAVKTLGDGGLAFDLGNGAEVAVVHVPVPYPNLSKMKLGPTSPSVEEMVASRAHIVVGALHLDRLAGPDPEMVDLLMMRVTSAVIATTAAVGVMLAHGVYFHQAQLFATLTVVHGEHERLPPNLAVNVTAGQTPAGRLTLLSHGLARYGRTELLVGCTTDMAASESFMWQMIEWLMADKIHRLVPGTLIPDQDGTEQIARGVPSPLGDGSTVVYIELGR